MTKTKEQLIIENEELHSRLAETEEALIAIRSGEVDAIVISGAKGEQVYSLSSAETPYRTFVEKMNEGAVTLSKKGIILYCNQRFAELVHEPIERVIGTYFKRFIVPNEIVKFNNLFARQTHNKNNVLIISFNNSLFLKLSLQLLPPYLQGDYCILVATDISEMKKKEQKLLVLHRFLEQKVDIIQRLRMQLIDRKIELKAEVDKLKISNNKLSKEIAKHKLVKEGSKPKPKPKRKKAIN